MDSEKFVTFIGAANLPEDFVGNPSDAIAYACAEYLINRNKEAIFDGKAPSPKSRLRSAFNKTVGILWKMKDKKAIFFCHLFEYDHTTEKHTIVKRIDKINRTYYLAIKAAGWDLVDTKGQK